MQQRWNDEAVRSRSRYFGQGSDAAIGKGGNGSVVLRLLLPAIDNASVHDGKWPL